MQKIINFIANRLRNWSNVWAGKRANLAEKCDGTECIDECLLIHGPINAWMYVYAIKACRYYHKKSFICVSTWKDTDESWLELVNPFVNHIILNDYPEYHGAGHRNYQIKAISTGLAYIRDELKRNGNENNAIVVKLRSDCVLKNKNIFTKMKNEIDIYTIGDKYGVDSRLFIIFPRIYSPYKACDFVMGGKIDRLQMFWDIGYSRPCDETELSESVEENILSKCTPEEFFYTTYAQNVHWRIIESLDNGWRYWKNFFVVWNMSDFGIVWLKTPIWNITRSWYGKWKRYPDIFYISKRMWKRMQSGIPYLGKMELKDVRLNRRIPLKWAIKLFFGKYK